MVNKDTTRKDLAAGLSGAIILLPQGVAYAAIAGMPPEYGLYAAIVPAIIASLFGSSWHLVSGPTAAISIVVFSAMSPLATPGTPQYVSSVLTLTFIVGVIQLAMGLARMGTLINFVSHTVVIGFTAGAAILISVNQLKNFFGIHIQGGASFSEIIQQFVSQASDINPHVTAVGAATLLSGVLIRKYYPKFPYMVAAMLVGSIVAVVLNWLVGAHSTGIHTVGALPASLPPFSPVDFSLESLRTTTSSALAIAVLGLTEAVSIARAVAVRSEQSIDSNQEFIGQGLSNLLGSFFSGYASSGSFTRSGVNFEAGARTPLATVYAAVFIVIFMLLVASLVAYLPIAAMAGILFIVAYSLIDFHHIKSILRTSRSESAVLLTTVLATLFVELVFAIYLGVILSLILFLERTSRPQIRDALPAPEEASYHFVPRADQPECCQLKMIFIDGAIFFGAVNHVQQTLHRIDELNPNQKHVLILAPGINFIDIAGGELLAREAKRRKRMGGGLYFHRLKDPVLEILTKGGYLNEIGRENLFVIGQKVIDGIYPKLDSEICRNCPARIFRQCNIALPNGEPR